VLEALDERRPAADVGPEALGGCRRQGYERLGAGHPHARDCVSAAGDTWGLPTAGPSPAERAGARAARNTAARAGAEIVGKLAALVLFAVLGREVGQAGLGAFVFAFAFLQIAVVPVDLGYDRYLLKRAAIDRAAAGGLLWDIVALKLVLLVPVGAVALAALQLIGVGAQSRETVYALAAGVLLESLARTVFSVFNAFERGGLLAASLVVQRILASGLGLVALATGHGVVTVAAAYSAGAAAGLALSLALVPRVIGPLRPRVERRGWGRLTRASAPFAVQDVFSAMLFKVDAVILSIMVTSAAVGRYGAAYRLLESTMFVSVAMTGAFAAMYTYLGPDTQPSIRAVFQRSLKLALVVLTPVAVAFGVLAEPLARAVFGADFESAADPLRILAPSVVLLGVVTLAASLFVSRRDPRAMVRVTGVMALLNVVLNLALIPSLEDTGAAIAMTATEALYCVVALRLAVRVAGGVDWPATAASPVLAGALGAVPMLLLQPTGLVPALAAGVVVYLAALAALERAIAPADLKFAAALVRRALQP
jgi:O-antigen/teichoic acid export membrane protein